MHDFPILIAPSILSCDFAAMGEDCRAMERAGADWLHVDVMDGHFVPNISIGVPVVKSLRPAVKLPLDVHLMISKPLDYLGAFLDAGADLITFHIESESEPALAIATIRKRGKRAGLVLKPATPAERAFPFLPLIDVVMVMTVEPGFGGQKFMPGMLPKIEALREEAQRQGLPLHIEVDGGIDPATVPLAVRAGADVLVAGSALFSKPDYAGAVRDLRAAAEAGRGL